MSSCLSGKQTLLAQMVADRQGLLFKHGLLEEAARRELEASNTSKQQLCALQATCKVRWAPSLLGASTSAAQLAQGAPGS